jgi:hypothetical protein
MYKLIVYLTKNGRQTKLVSINRLPLLEYVVEYLLKCASFLSFIGIDQNGVETAIFA